MSLSDNYPDIRPQWMNDYANAGVIDPRCSFARSDSTPSNVHYWSDEDHLSSENLLLQSSSLDTSPWTTSGASVNPTSVTGPDGATSDGWTLTEDGATNNHRVVQTFSANAPSDSYALTFYGKRGTGTRYASVVAYTSTNNYEIATFDLAGGAVTFYSGSSSTYTGVSATQTASGNGYYKCVFKFTGQVSGGAVYMSDVASPTSWGNYAVYQYAGDSSSSLVLSRFSLASTAATDYNATTTQIHRQYAATLKPVAYSGQPRFEYEPTGDREAKGLLIESSSSNLIARSYEIDNAYWSKQNTTVTAAAAVGVTGALNACLITEIKDVSPATSVHSVYSSSFGLSSATSCTFSVYCKAAGVNRVQLLTTVGGSVRNAVFNIADGSVVSESSATGVIESVGNGFYRISITYTAPATTNGRAYLNLINDSGTSDYAGNGYNSVIASAFQFEQNAFPSSYIATSGSASTRTADSLSVATADIGYTGGPFTLMAEATSPGETSYYAPAALHLDNSNQVVIYTNSFQGRLAAATSDGTANTLLGVRADGKTILSGDTNDLSAVMNGATPVTDSSYVLPDLSGANLYIGSRNGSSSPLNGHIKRVALYSEALTDTELQSLTS